MAQTAPVSPAECLALCHQQGLRYVYAPENGECACDQCPENTYLDARLNYCRFSTPVDACRESCSGRCTSSGVCEQCPAGEVQCQNACVASTSLEACIARIA